MREIHISLENELISLAVSRIYYCCFHLISALALKHGFASSKHKQLIGWFNKSFILPGIIDKKFGRFVHVIYEARTDSDYGDFIEFKRDQVEIWYSIVNSFFKVIHDFCLEE